jgi:two-component system OmpR family response regulator
VGSLILDPAARSVTLAGARVDLTGREYVLLELFARRAGDTLTRSEIIDRVWDWAYDGTSNIVDVYVRILRAKLADAQSAPRIETVRGIGYALRPVEATAGKEGAAGIAAAEPADRADMA